MPGANLILQGDCLALMQEMPPNSVDLVLCSPPYEDARTYGIDFNLKDQAWIEWAMVRYLECVRVSKGLVVWVVEGKTKDFRWSATPVRLMAALHECGVKLRKPPIYQRIGISGSGGPDWLRNDYELCICSSKGKMPWSENTAMGHPPKFPPGGNHSHHSRDGRVNKPRLQREGKSRRVRTYTPPKIANPGNIIRCHGGKGHMGSNLAHENEAPFPARLAEFFIRSFCPPGGIVLDCFSGSGTTAAVAVKHARNFIAIDCRLEMCNLTRRRVEEAKALLSALSASSAVKNGLEALS
jgi:DNA modification methylase